MAHESGSSPARRGAAHRVTAWEWRRVLLYALLVTVVTTLPYALAWAGQGDGWRFTGFLFGAEDGFSYLGKMRLGARDLWDFYLFYTPEPHAGAPLVFLPYIVPGHLAGRLASSTDPALPGLLALLFHGLRAGFGVLLIAVLYRFIAAFVASARVRFTALVLATLGGGLGWLLAFAGQTPPEFYIPEGFSFLILFGLPHLALARATLLAGLLALLQAQTNPRWPRLAALAGVCWWVVGLAVPFYLPLAFVILAAWGLVAWSRRDALPGRLAAAGLIGGAVTLPLLVYYAVLFSTHETFARWSAQNQLESPPPLHYALAYALLIVPGLLGLRVAWRRARRDIRWALLIAWPVVGLALVYLPANVQRRMGEGVIVPLAILAASGLHLGARLWAIRRRRRWTGRYVWTSIALLAAACLSSAIFLRFSLVAASNPSLPIFRPVEELAAFAWLNGRAAPDAVVLASAPTGNALPAYTNQRPYMGHGPETLDWQHKTRQLERFFGGEMPAGERQALLAEYRVRYVFYGPLERALAATPSAPAWAAGMTPVYERDGYVIYEVPLE
jgi:hypothetical protein